MQILTKTIVITITIYTSKLRSFFSHATRAHFGNAPNFKSELSKLRLIVLSEIYRLKKQDSESKMWITYSFGGTVDLEKHTHQDVDYTFFMSYRCLGRTTTSKCGLHVP